MQHVITALFFRDHWARCSPHSENAGLVSLSWTRPRKHAFIATVICEKGRFRRILLRITEKKKAWQNASANIINFQASSDLFGIKKEEEEEEEEEEDTKYNTTDLCGIPPEH